jgi:hypothetical protein
MVGVVKKLDWKRGVLELNKEFLVGHAAPLALGVTSAPER